MKLRLLILLAAAAVAAAPAAGQTIKSLGYNTTNGSIVYSGSNSLTFTNTLQFSTNARAATRTNLGLGATWLTNTSVTNFRTDIGLGAGDNVTFSNITASGNIYAKDSTGGAATNSTLARGIQWTNLGGSGVAAIYGSYPGTPQIYLAVGATNALTDVATFRSTGMTVASNAIVGGTLAVSNTATFSTNVSVAGSLTATGNATLNGSDNLMPNATNAASASSLMTRDLVGQEFANPRNKMQTTYWFGVEGLGQWGAVGQSATTSYLSARESSGVGGGQLIYSAAGIGVSASGAGLRLGSADPYGGVGIFTIAGTGDTTFKARLLKNTQAGVGPAMAFVMGTRTATNMWQNNAPGIYYVPQPTNAWVSNAVVTLHSRIAVTNVVFAVSTAGTNDATQPAWPDAINAVVTNGSAVYRNVGPHTSNNWVLAIGSTNASQVVMTNTGKVGPTSTSRASYVLTFRVNGTTNVFAKVETGTANGNTASESSEVSLGAPATTSDFQPQVWSRDDVGSGGSVDPSVRYISIDGPLGSLL